MELRWVLVVLGLLVIVGVYLWGNERRRAGGDGGGARQRLEPPVRDEGAGDERAGGDRREPRPQYGATVIERKPSPRRVAEKVIALRLIPRAETTGEDTVLALRRHGLEHGLYGIFHRLVDGDVHNPVFSVARLTEPGSFDLAKLAETEIPGLSLFLALPGSGDPVERFDSMIETARALGRDLDADLFDENGSSWSIQRERFLREEMIEYRHHLQHR